MKKLIIGSCVAVALAGSALVVGCSTIPTVEDMETVSMSVGVATGTVMNMTNISSTNRNAICSIVNEVKGYIPNTNESFYTAWMPIAKVHTQKLVDEGKIDQAAANLIVEQFGLVCKGADYLITVRYPKAKEYENLIVAAVHGFTDGFLLVFKPANVTCATAGSVQMDMGAFEFLKGEANIK